MAVLSSTQKQDVIKNFQRKDLDTGSTEVQVALLTFKIKELTEHFKKHPKDKHGTRGLIRMVNRRRSLLRYLKKQDVSAYLKLIAELGLRK